MPEINYLDKDGLSTVLDQLHTLCLTTVEGIAIFELISALADAVVYPSTDITIPTSGWTEEQTGGLALYYDVEANITSADSVNVVLDVDAFAEAQACGLCPTVETYDGYMRFRAVSVPETEITGHYRILRGPQQEE